MLVSEAGDRIKRQEMSGEKADAYKLRGIKPSQPPHEPTSVKSGQPNGIKFNQLLLQCMCSYIIK